MKIQFNTDKNIQGSETLEAFVSETVSKKLNRFANRITRVEVHLSDQNAHKTGGDDILCKIEARLEGLQPILAAGKGDSKEKALNEAIEKTKAALDTAVGKMNEK